MKTQLRTIAFLLAVMLCATFCTVFASATSTESTPTYTHDPNWGDHDGDGVFEVSTAEELLSVAAKRPANANYDGKVIKLTADIDLNPGWDASSGTKPTNLWQPMWDFRGTFDGQGHTIKGVCVDIPDNSNGGFIVTTNGNVVIKDLKFENCSFSVSRYNAAIVCSVKTGTLTFSNVYVDAIMKAAMGTAGGFVASTPDGSNVVFENCVFAGKCESPSRSGGFIGTVQNNAQSLTFTDCANYGEIVSSVEYAGAIVGCCGATATVTRFYNGGTVTAPEKFAVLGAFCQANTANIKFEDVYYDPSTGTTALFTNETATDITYIYDGKEANDIKTAPAASLPGFAAFKATETYKGWVVSATDINVVLPAVTNAMIEGHDYEAVVTPPTCGERGYTTYTCKDCGVSYQGDFVDTLPHTPSDEWIVDKEPSDKYAGSRHKECSVCHAVLETEILPKLESDETTAAEDDVTTQAPADDATQAPTDDTNSTTQTDGGCASSLALAPLALIATVSLGALVIGKKK